MNSFESLVSLNLIPGIGSVHLGHLLEYFNNPQEIFKASRQTLEALVGVRISQSVVSFDTKNLDNDLAQAKPPAMLVANPAVNPAAVPVMLVPIKADGVPRAGVTKVGEVEKTRAPVPVAPVEVTPSIV